MWIKYAKIFCKDRRKCAKMLSNSESLFRVYICAKTGTRIRSRCEKLQELHISLVFRTFLWFVFQARRISKTSRRRIEIFWTLAGWRAHWSGIVYHRCYSFFEHSSFLHFKIMKTVPNQPKSCPKTCSQLFKGFNRCRRSIYFCCSQAELKIDIYIFDIFGYSNHL